VESKRNVQAHYDLGNDMFSLFLDPSMTYSCAVFPSLPSHQLTHADMDLLEQAQICKCDRIIDLMAMGEGDGAGMEVLEVGCGWGSLGRRIKERYPRVKWTGLTLSKEQFQWVQQKLGPDGSGSMAEVGSGGCWEAKRVVSLGVEFLKMPENLKKIALISINSPTSPGEALRLPPGARLAQLRPHCRRGDD